MYPSNPQFLIMILLLAVNIIADEQPKDFTFHSKEEFCTANHNLLVNPKYIPVLLDYLRYCTALSKKPNGNAHERRNALIHLFETATPILHKAFFDSKTGLKQIVTFTRMKHDAVQFAKYADSYENNLFANVKRVNSAKGTMTYSPENNEGSYNLEEDLRLCSAILNREPNTGAMNLIKASQLPRVAKAARLITFPPFNLTVGVSGDDTPYLILDMYVLAMRCLSFTNLNADTNAQVSEDLIGWLKKKVMPFIPPHEFEKAYSGMMSLIEYRTDKTRSNDVRIFQTPIVKSKTMLKVEDFSEPPQVKEDLPILLKLQYDFKVPNDAHSEESSESVVSVTMNNKFGTSSAIHCNTEQVAAVHTWQTELSSISAELQSSNEIKSVLDVVADKVNEDEVEEAVSEEPPTTQRIECHACSSRLSSRAIITIGIIVGACGTLALILYCLLFGCCGWVSVSKSSTKCGEETDDIDSYLEDYARQRMTLEGQFNKCYCTRSDTNQMDVIVALHKRCETLSKKICDVIREISKESIFEDTNSMEILREFIRNISEEMVDDDDETVRQLRKIHEQSVKTHSCHESH